MVTHGVLLLAERFGSGDGERKTLLTRQIAFEPLPASVLFGPVVVLFPFMCLMRYAILKQALQIGSHVGRYLATQSS